MTLSNMVEPPTDGGEQTTRDRAAERYTAQEVLWRESSLERVRRCGRTPSGAGGIAVKATGLGATRSAGFAGVQSCGSVWACAVCSAKIAATRQAELSAALSKWRAQGHTVTLVTLTMRHKSGQSLEALWDALGKAWARVTSGRAWKGEQERYGLEGWCRVVEVTHGRNGWHVHIHALVFTRADHGDPADLGPLMFQRWRKGLMAQGMAAPLARHGGLDVRVLAGCLEPLADYFTKNVYRSADDLEDDRRAALEVARGDLKDARHGNRTPFRVLADVVALGDLEDLDLWHEWEKGSHGKRQMTWSRGLRALLLGVELERTDQEIADEDLGGDVLVEIDRDGWRDVCKTPGERARIKRVAESDDTGENLRRYLEWRGIGYRVPGVEGPPVDVDALAARRSDRHPNGPV